MSAQVVYKKEMASSMSLIVFMKEIEMASLSTIAFKNEMQFVSSIDRIQDPKCPR